MDNGLDELHELTLLQDALVNHQQAIYTALNQDYYDYWLVDDQTNWLCYAPDVLVPAPELLLASDESD